MKPPTDKTATLPAYGAAKGALPRRLDKFVRESTNLSLKDVRDLLRTEKIQCRRLNASTAWPDPCTLVYDSDEILLRGKRLVRRTNHDTYVLNKPKNVTSTAQDPDGKRDISEWLAQMSPVTFPIGRLDRETTGALLFSTDGDLATAVLRPDHQTHKLYWLWLNESLAPTDVRLTHFTSGVEMLGGLGKAESVEILAADEHKTELLVTLAEGKNREIRRMCRALDLRLLHLHRKSIGPVALNTLALGEFRLLHAEEVASLWESLGGRECVELKQVEALRRLAHCERSSGAPNVLLEEWLEAYDCHQLEPNAEP